MKATPTPALVSFASKSHSRAQWVLSEFGLWLGDPAERPDDIHDDMRAWYECSRWAHGGWSPSECADEAASRGIITPRQWSAAEWDARASYVKSLASLPGDPPGRFAWAVAHERAWCAERAALLAAAGSIPYVPAYTAYTAYTATRTRAVDPVRVKSGRTGRRRRRG